ncbi:NUDIX hydrolase [Reichenbachiella ulvae]|uniref:NUDIX hydrolase n=1 Tax=Reichenbachiella ulvae TaxID=2980104 RepID=A0ABT3CNP1_9BACT|nr:NUDIX hydrolase [Reichenbachiella ulvae]MCV9385330.1 NUDIX hydrolase [Reichenbachiella ulvae]
MNRAELISQIENYQSEHAEEMEMKGRFLDLLLIENCFERSLAIGHITASAWVVNPAGDEVLLLHHRKLDRWLQPGGHADGDEDVIRVAQKELEEETGLEDVILLQEGIFDLDIHSIPARKSDPEHEHFDIRFAFVAKYPDRIKKNEESHDLAWIPLDQLESYVGGERSILRMRDKMFA